MKTKFPPHLNACQLGYAHSVLDRLKTGKASREEIETELSKRTDEIEIRALLNEIRGRGNESKCKR